MMKRTRMLISVALTVSATLAQAAAMEDEMDIPKPNVLSATSQSTAALPDRTAATHVSSARTTGFLPAVQKQPRRGDASGQPRIVDNPPMGQGLRTR